MPRKCTICTSKKVNDVNTLIGQGVSFRHISSQVFGKPNRYNSICRHTTNCLKFDVQKALAEKQLESKIDAYKSFQESLEIAVDVRRIAKEYLDSHPEDFTGAIRACNDAIKTTDSTIDKFAKIEGLYTDNKENPANEAPEDKANRYYLELIRLEFSKEKALEETRKEYKLATFEPKEEYVN